MQVRTCDRRQLPSPPPRTIPAESRRREQRSPRAATAANSFYTERNGYKESGSYLHASAKGPFECLQRSHRSPSPLRAHRQHRAWLYVGTPRRLAPSLPRARAVAFRVLLKHRELAGAALRSLCLCRSWCQFGGFNPAILLSAVFSHVFFCSALTNSIPYRTLDTPDNMASLGTFVRATAEHSYALNTPDIFETGKKKSP